MDRNYSADTEILWGGRVVLSKNGSNGVTNPLLIITLIILFLIEGMMLPYFSAESKIKYIYATILPCYILYVSLPRQEIIRYFKMYPETIKALKVRMSKAMCQPYGLKPVFKTQEIAKKVREAGYHCNVICHYGNLPDGEKMEDFIDAFQAGDIISHMYHPSGDSIFNQDGRVMECVK